MVFGIIVTRANFQSLHTLFVTVPSSVPHLHSCGHVRKQHKNTNNKARKKHQAIFKAAHILLSDAAIRQHVASNVPEVWEVCHCIVLSFLCMFAILSLLSLQPAQPSNYCAAHSFMDYCIERRSEICTWHNCCKRPSELSSLLHSFNVE